MTLVAEIAPAAWEIAAQQARCEHYARLHDITEGVTGCREAGETPQGHRASAVGILVLAQRRPV